MNHDPRNRRRATPRALLLALLVSGSLALGAPTAHADESADAQNAKLASLETGEIGLGIRLTVADTTVDTGTLTVPVVHAADADATRLLPGDAADALDVAGLPAGTAIGERPGDTPERAILLDDTAIPLLPDYAIMVTTTSGGHGVYASKIARTGHALTVTGLTVTFPDVSLTNALTDGAGITPDHTAGALPAHDPYAYDPSGARLEHTPRPTGTTETGSTEGATAGSDATAHAQSATAAPGSRSLAAKAAFAAAALSIPALLGWTLYHRMRGPAVLQNATRKALYDAIMDEPGIGVQELSDRIGISYSTTMYHLNRLASGHMIVQSQDGNKLRYYKNGGAFNEKERHVLPLLKNAEVLKVLSIILENPGTYRAEIATRMGVTATTVNWHLKRLVKHELIHQERRGRSAHLYVDRDRLTRHLDPLLPKLHDADADLAGIAERLMATAHGHAPETPGHTPTPASA